MTKKDAIASVRILRVAHHLADEEQLDLATKMAMEAPMMKESGWFGEALHFTPEMLGKLLGRGAEEEWRPFAGAAARRVPISADEVVDAAEKVMRGNWWQNLWKDPSRIGAKGTFWKSAVPSEIAATAKEFEPLLKHPAIGPELADAIVRRDFITINRLAGRKGSPLTPDAARKIQQIMKGKLSPSAKSALALLAGGIVGQGFYKEWNKGPQTPNYSTSPNYPEYPSKNPSGEIPLPGSMPPEGKALPYPGAPYGPGREWNPEEPYDLTPYFARPMQGTQSNLPGWPGGAPPEWMPGTVR